MKYMVNVNDKTADVDARSLRDHVKDREKTVLRDTYYLIEQGIAPSRTLTMGQTVIYPTGSTTGHSHDDMEEVYYVISGEGEMVVGEDRYPVRAGDALYVPPGEFHTTFQKGNLPLTVVWVTAKLENK
ncbi:MAG: cupin domain-containing protein [Oscillospiraceae bacterium]|nr:cupin domain-containing protein [Oscillospiraceae bacterium]